MKTALITGISGQAGFYLSQLLSGMGYRVVGTTRDIRRVKSQLFGKNVELISLNLLNPDQVMDLVDELRPDEIYHFAAPSSVARSFGDPVKAVNGITLPSLNVLDAIRKVDNRIRFLEAGSIEMFGECPVPADELTPLEPHSPYGVGKGSSFLQTKNYREAFGVHACSAIFSNFESPLRPISFVTAKIVSVACQMAVGEDVELSLGNLDIHRDWGWAPEYMDAAWRMLQMDNPTDLVIATGTSHSLRDFMNLVFEGVGLQHGHNVKRDPYLLRPFDVRRSSGNPSKAGKTIDWRAEYSLQMLVDEWIEAEMRRCWANKKTSRKLYSISQRRKDRA